jgi:hypothetical protein
MNARFRAHQIVRLTEFASTELQITLSPRTVARAFEIAHLAVKRTQLRGYDDLPARGRHHELVVGAEQQLVDWITARAANNVAVNGTEFVHECNERFGKRIKRGWVDSFLTRHAEQLFETKSIPQENPRFEVPRVFPQTGLDRFRDHVHQACAELVFNLDESGIREREDRCMRRLIVPSAMKGQTVFHGVHRNLKHISVVACISAAGEHITPSFVSSQVNSTVERQFKSDAFRLGVDLILKH